MGNVGAGSVSIDLLDRNQDGDLFDYHFTSADDMREQWGVNTAAEEAAFQASGEIAYSGPERRRAMYDALLAKQASGEPLNRESILEEAGRYGNLAWEIAGAVVVDPLNLLDGGARHATKARGLRSAISNLMEPDLRKASEIVDEMSGLASHGGQIAEELRRSSTLVDKAGNPVSGVKALGARARTLPTDALNVAKAAVNPRLPTTSRYLMTQDATQATNMVMQTLERRVLTQMGDAARATPEFQQAVHGQWTEAIDSWRKLANDDTFEEGMEGLRRMGLDAVPASRVGRRTAALLDTFVDGEHSIHKLVTDAATGAPNREEALARIAEGIAQGTESLIPDPTGAIDKFISPIYKIPQGISEKLKPITNVYSTLFMGMSPGFAMRNGLSNLTLMLVNGTNPLGLVRKNLDGVLRPAATALDAKKAARLDVIGPGKKGGDIRDMARYGDIKETKWGPFSFGFAASNMIENASADAIIGHTQDMMNGSLWKNRAMPHLRQALTETGLPPDVVNLIDNKLRGLAFEDADGIAAVRLEIEQLLGLAPDASVGSPASLSAGVSGPGIGRWGLDEGTLDDILNDVAQTVEAGDTMGVAPNIQRVVRRVLRNSENRDDVAAGFQQLLDSHADRLQTAVQGEALGGGMAGTTSADLANLLQQVEDLTPQLTDQLAEF
jgi:hypothetical protein